MVANLEVGYVVSEKGMNPVTNVGWEALVVDDLG